MSAARPALYIPPTRGIVPGAVFLHVPVPYPPRRLMATSVVSRGLLQIEPDFARAWQDASPRVRDVGLPTLMAAKPRPVVVVAVGAAEEDTWHRDNVWVAPHYSHKEYQARRHGRNLFDLPSASQFGLDEDGFLDFFQMASVPITYLDPRHHRCNLSPDVFDALLTALRACIVP